ncbi:MAG: glycosyltransferase [Ruminococcus sp.]|nr:glycosyltransferase [Ruminococcus sp.]
MNCNSKGLPPYSVLMSVYAGEQPEYLRLSIQSMIDQTFRTNDFILVCDGELTDELNEVVSEYEKEYSEIFHVVRLEKNVGTGQCANIGIEKCRNEYIVKMDSDDVALPERCEKQIRLLYSNPALDMCGAFIREFDTDTNEIIAIKKTPKTNDEIHKYARRRNPFNNQTLVFKKSVAKRIGGYTTVKRCEDYDFVVRMLDSGAKGENIQEVLVDYRVSKSNYERRQNWANTKSFVSVRWKIFRMGYSNIIDFLVPCAAQMLIFILPKSFTGKIYKRFLRR